jgi:hypothetical protein
VATGGFESPTKDVGGEMINGIVKIMPCLDMKDGRIVKGVHFVGLRDAGDPVENALFYQNEGADELAMLDNSYPRNFVLAGRR